MTGWTRPVQALVAAVAVVALVIGLTLFQPWRVFVDETIDEADPVTAASAPIESSPSPTTRAEPAPSAKPRPTPKPKPTNKIIASGELITHEHPTSGRVKIIETADGRRVLRLEDLDTTSGPDLRIWLSEAPVIEGVRGWRVFADHDHLELGALKGNRGNQNYLIPADADLDELSSVSIWCRRFSVSFGAAELEAH